MTAPLTVDKKTIRKQSDKRLCAGFDSRANQPRRCRHNRGETGFLSANKSWCNTSFPGSRSKEKLTMEATLFFVIWLGGAILHTLFELRIKPVLQAHKEESDLF